MVRSPHENPYERGGGERRRMKMAVKLSKHEECPSFKVLRKALVLCHSLNEASAVFRHKQST